MLLERLAMYGVPVAAGLVTAAVLIGPGDERPAVGARVRGLVAAGASSAALQVHTVSFHRGVYRPVSVGELTLELSAGADAVGRWSGRTDQAGIAEALCALQAPVDAQLGIRLSAAGEPLAIGDVEVAPSLQVDPPLRPTPPAGETSLSVWTNRGFAVPPFPEVLEIAAVQPRSDDPDAAPATPTLVVKPQGAEVHGAERPPRVSCSGGRCRYRWRVQVAAKAPSVQLEVEVTSPDGPLGRWQGQLPLQAGGIWLDPKLREGERGLELVMRAATPRDEVFVSLVSARGRFFAAVVPTMTDDRGFSSAILLLPPLPDEPISALLSSAAAEVPGSTTAWPLQPDRGQVAQPFSRVLVDGMPAAIAAEERRQTMARRPAYGLVLAAGLFELLYLWRRRRRARVRLDAHLRRASAEVEREADARTVAAMQQSMPLLWLIILMGGLALMFAILAALAAFGPG